MRRTAMWLLLAVVAGAAAVLSFSALRDLAILCGFSERLAPLLPVVIDAGAAAGCLVWLGQLGDAGGRGFARTLTWVLLASSVAGNAVVHGLTAYHQAAPWWLVVAVSAVAPAVLGAVVHLAVKVGNDRTAGPEQPVHNINEVAEGDGPGAGDLLARTRELINANDGAVGRGRLAEHLGVSEHKARQLLAELSNSNGHGSAR